MAATPDLTIREAAELAGVPKKTIEKAVEARIVKTISKSVRLPGRATQFLSLQAVVFFAALKKAELVDLPVHHKKAIWKQLSRQKKLVPRSIEFSPGTTLDVKTLAKETAEAAFRYKAARDKHIVCNQDILGGTPVIRGTRITVYSVLGRLQHGDSLEDLFEDYPDIPEEAFEAAVIFAKTHPMRGRPSGRPWRNAV
jgi:uncharacterized protein (DUF433 family)